jgi:hypothetical protein
METEGWLFDVYPRQSTMVLWIYSDDGGMLRLEDPYRHHIYVRERREGLEGLLGLLRKRGFLLGFRWARKQDFWSGQEIDVLRISGVGRRWMCWIWRWGIAAICPDCSGCWRVSRIGSPSITATSPWPNLTSMKKASFPRDAVGWSMKMGGS